MPYNTPIGSIVTSSIGRGAELKYGPGNNQYARASDVNPIIDYIDARASENITTATGNSVTINAPIGRVTTASLTTAGAYATTTITVTNSAVTANSVICAYLEVYAGTIGTNGIPIIYKVVPAAGSFQVIIANIHPTAGNALNNTITFSFRVS